MRVNKKEVLCNKAKREIEIGLEASGECVTGLQCRHVSVFLPFRKKYERYRLLVT